MKKLFLLTLVVIIAALSVIAVSAAPRDRYYDQMGNKYWCNVDGSGCWITGENGEKEYIMFWSESSRAAIMGPDSNAPIGTLPGTSELPLQAPKPAPKVLKKSTKVGTCEAWEELQADGSCKQVQCSDNDIANCEIIAAGRNYNPYYVENDGCYCGVVKCEDWEELQSDGKCKQVACSPYDIASCDQIAAGRKYNPYFYNGSCYCGIINQ